MGHAHHGFLEGRTMTLIRCENVTKVFAAPNRGTCVTALQDLTCEIRDGEFVCILGPNGCGKTTFLHMLAGFEAPTQGTIRLRDTEIRGPSPERGMVFQELSLFPWKSVMANMEFGLKVQGWDRTRRREVAMEYLDLVGLHDFGSAKLHELSGGMQKKLAIARTMVLDPDILLMDEPVGSMDEQTRAQLDAELLRIWGGRRKTVVFVTHSIEEALTLADRILLFTARPGTIRFSLDLNMPRPRNTFSPDMIGLRTKLFDELNQLTNNGDD